MTSQTNKQKTQEVKPGQTLAELAALASATQEGKSPTPGATFPEGGTPPPAVEGEGQENSDNDTNERGGDEDLSDDPLPKPIDVTGAKLLAETSVVMGQGEPDPGPFAANGDARTLIVVKVEEGEKPEQAIAAAVATVANEPTQADAVKASLRGMNTSMTHIDELGVYPADDSGTSGKIVESAANALNFGNPAFKPSLSAGMPLNRGDASKPLKVFPATISILGKSVLRQLDEYTANMDPRKSATIESINQNQVALFRSFVITINKLTNDFQYVWEGILAAFNENVNGVFDEVNVYRGAQSLSLSADERNTFYRLLNLIKITASPKGRSAALKQVDPVASLSTGDVLTHEGRDKVMSYFKL